MIHKIQQILMLSLVALTFAGAAAMFDASTSYAAPATPAAAGSKCYKGKLLTLPHWYRGIVDGKCNITIDAVGGKIEVMVTIIALNIVEILMHVTAYVSAGFIIYGGFQYITSTGSPDGNVKGRKTIMNASIGLILSIMSVGIVAMVMNYIT